MPPRQVAWIRRANGDWLAVVLMPAGSANGQSSIMMQLWLEPHLIATTYGDAQTPESPCVVRARGREAARPGSTDAAAGAAPDREAPLR